jgi:glycosyltransferase involved in cell wall biosynthesis
VSNQNLDPRSRTPDINSGRAHLTVAILMCTYNGASFLRAQLDSFEAQSFDAWTLYISDDGSTDATRDIIAEYRVRWGDDRLICFEGPQCGFAQNFLSLVRRSEIKADFFAFSDQDDIWFSDKLSRAVFALHKFDPDAPNLYCSRTRLVDKAGHVIGHSPLFNKPPSFRNALVQSIAGANTMLINESARRVLTTVSPAADVIAHDWLIYLLVSGGAGKVIYDADPTLDYRQHSKNLIGSNFRWRDRLRRVAHLLSGKRKAWTDANLAVLESMNEFLTEEAKTTVMHFVRGRSSALPIRLLEIKKAGVYRQTVAGSLSLFAAVCLRKV